MIASKQQLKIDIAFIQSLVAKNGPDEADYDALNAFYDKIGGMRENGSLSEQEVDEIRSHFGEAYLTPKTLLGFTYCKPHGYAGDYEMIDYIYTQHVSSDEKFKKWDIWFQLFSATKAVRNRKTYFKQLLASKIRTGKTLRVLNLASGPCRDIMEFLDEYPDASIVIDCIEMDPNAIKYAKALLGNYMGKQVHFIQANVFKFSTDATYDLIWSAGLFDYFDNKTFALILGRYKKNRTPDGEIVIGNFHPSNKTKKIMEFTSWHLHHRNETTMRQLAQKAGFTNHRIEIETEPEGVNLFMRIKS